MGMDEGDGDPVPLPNVNVAILKRSLSGGPTSRMTRMTLLLLKMMRTEKFLFGTEDF